jgi:DNA-binding SARP family transcriptional activator
MELMWPDHSLGSARNNLNAALYSLRNTLDQQGRKIQYILYRDGCYLPNPELMWWIDRTEFLTSLQHAEMARRGGYSQQQLVSRQYQLCSAALHNELGVSPGDDTVQLFRSLTSRA